MRTFIQCFGEPDKLKYCDPIVVHEKHAFHDGIDVKFTHSDDNNDCQHVTNAVADTISGNNSFVDAVSLWNGVCESHADGIADVFADRITYNDSERNAKRFALANAKWNRKSYANTQRVIHFYSKSDDDGKLDTNA